MPIEEVAQRIAPLYNHNADHVEAASGDPTVMEETAQMRQMMQQIGEVISNGLKRLEAMKQEQAAEGEAEQAQGGGENAQMLAEVEKHRQEMQMKQESFDLEQQLKVKKAETDIQIEDAKAAAKIRRDAKTTKP